MAKSIEDRVAFLERHNERLLTALGRHFRLDLEPDAEAIDLEAMTKAQLADHAAATGIDLGDASTKADMIAAIQLAK